MTLSTSALLVATNRAETLETVLRWILHDFRNPVQTLAFLPIFDRAETEPGDTQEWREAFATACGRLARNISLVDRLIGRPPGPAEPQPVVLGEVLGFLMELFSTRRGRLRIDVAAACGAPVPAVAAVRHDLETALLNLMLNAAEATGQTDVRLTAVVTLRPGGVDLVLEDDGPGIPEALLPRLFEPYATTRTDRPTRGLGLYAARQLLAASGGDVRYEAGSPGSRFVVSLPEWRSADRPRP